MGNNRRQQRPDDISTAITVEESLKEATREARGVLKDLAAERKAMEALIARIPQITEEAVNDQVKAEIAKLAEATEAAMRHAVARVNRTFDDMAAILTGEDKASQRAGKTSLADLVQIAYGKRVQTVQVEPVLPQPGTFTFGGCGHEHEH
jgi:hypothetical protein